MTFLAPSELLRLAWHCESRKMTIKEVFQIDDSIFTGRRSLRSGFLENCSSKHIGMKRARFCKSCSQRGM